jgi:hypothetical protein
LSEDQSTLFEPTFNRSVKIRGKDERITSDAGALLLREADHRLGITADLASALYDPRQQDKIRYQLVELLRERIYALALGYNTQDDLDILAHDPAMKASVWDRPGDQVAEERLASQPTHSRLMNILTWCKSNLGSLRGSLAASILRHQRATGGDHAVMHGTIDIDGFPIETFGKQEGAAYNGYHKTVEYYPLVASFSAEGDYDHLRLGDGFLHALLRKGNAGPAEGALRFILKALKKAAPLAKVLDIRFDAAFTNGLIMDRLTDLRIRFLGRLKGNDVLKRMAAPHLHRPPGRPPKEGYESIVELGWYQAEEWRHAQRIVLVVVDRPDRSGQLKLIPDHFFLVTTWTQEEKDVAALLDHYRRRGTFEDRIGEFNQALSPHLSLPSFVENEGPLPALVLAFLCGKRSDAPPDSSGFQSARHTTRRIGERFSQRMGPRPFSTHRFESGRAYGERRPADLFRRGRSRRSVLGASLAPYPTLAVAGTLEASPSTKTP